MRLQICARAVQYRHNLVLKITGEFWWYARRNRENMRHAMLFEEQLVIGGGHIPEPEVVQDLIHRAHSKSVCDCL